MKTVSEASEFRGPDTSKLHGTHVNL